MIGDCKLQPLLGRIADFRNQPAGRTLAAGADAEHRQKRQIDPEQLQPPALEAHPLVVGILDHFGGGDRPARPLRAAARRGHRARTVDRRIEGDDIASAHPAPGGDSAAAVQNHQKIVDRPVAKRIGEKDVVADQLVALRRQHDDAAKGADFAGLAVPHDAVGGEGVALALHAHGAGRGKDVGIAVVADFVGTEGDILRRGGGLWSHGNRRHSGRRRLRVQRPAHRDEHRERRPPRDPVTQAARPAARLLFRAAPIAPWRCGDNLGRSFATFGVAS